MIKHVSINSVSVNAFNNKHLSPTHLPELTDDILDLMVEFEDEQERDDFISTFPKSLNVARCTPTGYPNLISGDWTVQRYYCARLVRMPINDITGADNEIGDKRMKRFYDAVKAYMENK